MEITFKGKTYPLKKLFIRDQAKVAKLYRLLASTDDEEIHADCYIKILVTMTGIDEGDINGSSLAEVTEALKSAQQEKKDLPPEAGAASSISLTTAS